MIHLSNHKDLFFKNRKHAGEALASLLEPKYKHLHPLVIGIPRGGVEVAWYVAKKLDAPLSLIIAKKLAFPGHSEFGFGAIAEDNSVYISAMGKDMLEPDIITGIITEQAKEVNRRVEKYRNGAPLPDLKNRTVIIVDDGIATGVTLVPVIRLCRKKGAANVIVAVPVSGPRFDTHLNEADQLEILVQPDEFYAVGQVYEQFGDFSDKALLELIHSNDRKA